MALSRQQNDKASANARSVMCSGARKHRVLPEFRFGMAVALPEVFEGRARRFVMKVSKKGREAIAGWGMVRT
jgi:hypothetical protein